MIKELLARNRIQQRGNLDIACSECGAPVGDDGRERRKRLRLICYARKLNAYFRNARAYSSPSG